MRHLFLTILIRHPIQDSSSTIVIEIDINIRQGNTVGIQETFEQQVIGNRVNLCDTQAIGHRRTCRRATSRPYRHVQFLTGRTDEVLHNEEVTRETHCLHNVKFKLDTLAGFFIQHFTIALTGPFQRQFLQVIGLQFDAVQLVIPAQLLYLGVGIIFTQHHVTVLVPGELIEQVLFGIFLPIAFFGAEILGNLEVRHNRCVVDAVKLHLVADVGRIRQGFGHIGKEFVHLRLGLHPLLLGIKHSLRVVQILSRTQTNQAVVCLGIFLIHKVYVVGTHQFHAILPGVFYQFGIGNLLQVVRFVIGPCHGGFMALQLQIEVIAEHPLVPLDGFFSLIQLSLYNLTRHFARHTSRTDYQPLVILFQLHAVGTGTHIVPFCPGLRHQLDKVVIALLILGQHHQVITALVGLPFLII